MFRNRWSTINSFIKIISKKQKNQEPEQRSKMFNCEITMSTPKEALEICLF